MLGPLDWGPMPPGARELLTFHGMRALGWILPAVLMVSLGCVEASSPSQSD
jgi:hypothetical protein